MYIWESPLEIGAVLIVLCFILNVPSAFAGVACSFILMPVLMHVSKLFAYYRSQTARATDQRVRYISEMIDGIASVKSYAWETPFFYLVRKLRTIEINVIAKSQLLRAVNQGVMFSMANVASFATFAVYWGMGNTLTIPKIFSTISLLQLMRMSLGTMWLKSMEKGSEAIASCKRIESFLSLVGDVDDGYFDSNSNVNNNGEGSGSKRRTSSSASVTAAAAGSAASNGKYAAVGSNDNSDSSSAVVASIEMTSTTPAIVAASPSSTPPSSAPLITIAPSSYYYGSDPSKPSLVDVQLSVSRGEILIVVGPVGCGKSSLLSAVLGEISMVPSDYSNNSSNNKDDAASSTNNNNNNNKRVLAEGTSLAYCAQRPWILASSVKSNIALAGSGDVVEENFKRPTHINNELYTLAVESCLIVDDLTQWPAYDETEVGERGISISGGQKARISLARAVYSDADCKFIVHNDDDDLGDVNSSYFQLNHLFLLFSVYFG